MLGVTYKAGIPLASNAGTSILVNRRSMALSETTNKIAAPLTLLGTADLSRNSDFAPEIVQSVLLMDQSSFA